MDCVASSSTQTVATEESTRLAAEKLEEGVKTYQANQLDSAVELLGAALELHVDMYGATAGECARPYHQYGAALFAKAQEESDVFGSSVHQQASAPQKANASEELDKENRKGKGKMTEMTQADDGKGDGDDDDDDDSEAGDEGNDMQLAWEMLELAKLCYGSDVSQHRQQLADVHILLGDIGMEQEAFDGALSDYSESIKLLQAEKGIDRMLAELHYKTALALQFLDEPERALEHNHVAIGHCESQMKKEPVEGTPGGEAADSSGLQSILVDLQAKGDDLRDAIQQRTSTKNAMKAAFMQLAGTVAPSAQNEAGPSSLQPVGTASTSSMSRLSEGAVQDLGVVGRGNKRIKLAPAPMSGQDAIKGLVQAQASVSSIQPSRLDQLMNSSSTTIGFGSSKPAAVPLAPRDSLQHANGPSQKAQVSSTVSQAGAAHPSANPPKSAAAASGQELKTQPA